MSHNKLGKYRISVDTGGTFTDVVVTDGQGETHLEKALTTYHRAFEGIANALGGVADRLGLTVRSLLSETHQFSYGTTRSTNAIVEEKTAKTAFFTTHGFPDTLLLKEGGKLNPFLQEAYPPAYVPRSLTFEIDERIDSDGSVFIPLNEASIEAAIESALALDCRAIGVCLLWSMVNPSHELAVGELISRRAPEISFTLSHQLNPVIREYRRASSTVIDASLKPLMQSFLQELESDLREAGFNGNLFVSTSFGGTWRPREVIERPIFSVGSGPSMAPVAAVTCGQRDLPQIDGTTPDLLACDIGGTTFDVSLVTDNEIHYTSETWLGGRWRGHITGTRAVDVRSIGAGGGSIAWIDAGGLLHVGPQSAGADPGPACYGLGGASPTITDAAAVLGYLDGSNFLGGELTFDRDAATAAFAPISEQLGKSTEESALAALTIAGENIVNAVREITIAQGIDPRSLLILAGGGAAGINIVPIARRLGIHRVLLPKAAGALSAYGALFADMVSEFSVSHYTETRSLDRDGVNAAIAQAEARADEFIDSLRDLETVGVRREYSVEARYQRQVWELNVPLPTPRLETADDIVALEQAFHQLHQRTFAVSDSSEYLECLSWKVKAIVTLPRPVAASLGQSSDRMPVPAYTSPAYFPEEGSVEAPKFTGAELVPGALITGPAIVQEPTTTVVIYPGSSATVTEFGSYLIDTDCNSDRQLSQSSKVAQGETAR